jgi:tRNA nucleotidyltransferase (CCA-adding enzyme)
MTLERDVLDRISPSEDERREIDQRVRALLAVTAKEARKADPALGVLLVGSVAKDTFLKDPDLDVFILFPDSVPRERLESTGLGIGRKILDQHEERYAEHPYIHGSWEGLEVDMVPCYRIKDTTRLR